MSGSGSTHAAVVSSSPSPVLVIGAPELPNSIPLESSGIDGLPIPGTAGASIASSAPVAAEATAMIPSTVASVSPHNVLVLAIGGATAKSVEDRGLF